MCDHKGVVDDATVQVVSEEDVQQAPAPSRSQSGGKPYNSGGQAKSQYWDNKEVRDIATGKDIAYQASRNAAIAMVSVLQKEGAINYGKSTTAGAKQDSILSLVDELTERYVDAIPSNVEAS